MTLSLQTPLLGTQLHMDMKDVHTAILLALLAVWIICRRVFVLFILTFCACLFCNRILLNRNCVLSEMCAQLVNYLH